MNAKLSGRLGALACLAFVAPGASAGLYWGFDLGMGLTNTRGPRTNCDAAYNAFCSNFGPIGVEGFESKNPGPLPSGSTLNFTGTAVTGIISGYTPQTGPPIGPPEVHLQPVGTNAGCYPTDGIRYLSMGMAANSGNLVSEQATITFSSAVRGFGLYITDAEHFSALGTSYIPGLRINFVGGGYVATSIMPAPTSSTPSGSLWFVGYASTSTNIASVALDKFGGSGDRVGIDTLTVGLAAVPEPTSMFAMAAGALGLAARKRFTTGRYDNHTKEQLTS